MSSPRWHQIKEIVDSALKRDPSERAGFLDASCPDSEIRKEVDSLLAFEEKGFLEKPAVGNLVAPTFPLQDNAPPADLIGQTLSHYKVLDEISRGGMGIVYRAVDLKLNREVAFKVLPPELMTNQDRKRRFVREAQAAAALEHPHIAVIYEIDDAAGVTFIAMELIRGEKLSDTLYRERLPLSRSLALAVEIAEGLSRAHGRGIVHRDLKPANVMITEDGHAKIIDFGLAKLVEPTGGWPSDLETATRGRTESGILVGTVSYMSPEQARAENVDHRSDIFSFGTVLYEMLTGTVPFKAPSGAETLNAIINTPAPPLSSSIDVDVGPRLQHILDNCLAKAPEKRYPAMTDLVSELRVVKRESESLSPAVGARAWRPPSPRRVKAPFAAAMAAALLVVGVGLYLFFSREPPLPRLTNPVQVTVALGVEDFPAWSPDGRSLTYAASQSGVLRGGNWDIWVTQVGGGPALNRTPDYTGMDSFPSWSPDARQIAFHSSRDGGGIFVMSPLTGPPRKVASYQTSAPEWSSSPRWSKDGTELAYIDMNHIKVVSLDGVESRHLHLAGRSDGRYDLDWSPDGRLFAYVSAQNRTSTITQVWVLRVADGEAVPLTDGQWKDWSPTWSSDGRSVYFVSNRGGAMDLWQQRVGADGTPLGEPQSLTVGIGMRRAVFSPDESRLAYSDGQRVANLYRVPILADRPATWEDAEQLTFDRALISVVNVSRDGKRLAFNSNRTGNPDLWIMPAEGGEIRQLTTDPTPDWSPSWSPNGQEIAFYSYRSGNRHIWVMPTSGGPARQLTHSEAEDYHPRWSPDGREIAFFSLLSGNMDIWVVPAEGGEPRQLTDHPGGDFSPQWSPDGRWLVFVSARTGSDKPTLWRVSVDGGSAEPVTEGAAWYPLWSRDGKRIFFVGFGERAGNIWEVPAEGGFERPLTDLAGKRGSLGSEALATDEEYLYFAWEEDLGDIWVMDVANRQ